MSSKLRRIALLVLVGLFAGCSGTPQVLEDEAVFKELDAMFTALNSRKIELVEDCRKRFSALNQERRLSDAGYQAIDRIAARGVAGEWQPAAEELYRFIRAQRKPKS